MTKEELEKEKCELLGIIQGKDKVIKDLEWQIKQILEDNESYQKENAELKAYNEKLLDGDIEKHNKIVELKEENRQLRDEVEDLSSYWNQIGKVKTEVLKAFEHIVAK